MHGLFSTIDGKADRLSQVFGRRRRRRCSRSCWGKAFEEDPCNLFPNVREGPA